MCIHHIICMYVCMCREREIYIERERDTYIVLETDHSIAPE